MHDNAHPALDSFGRAPHLDLFRRDWARLGAIATQLSVCRSPLWTAVVLPGIKEGRRVTNAGAAR
jgi:hypothetical protein